MTPVANSQPVKSNGTDYVDHAADRIYIWPQPTINIVVQPPVGSATKSQASWSFGSATGQGPLFSFAQWLNSPSTMPASVALYLSNFGVTSQYYNEILQHSDTFALGNTQLDPGRFILQTTLPYEPVLPTQPYPAPAVAYTVSKAACSSSSWRPRASGFGRRTQISATAQPIPRLARCHLHRLPVPTRVQSLSTCISILSTIRSSSSSIPES